MKKKNIFLIIIFIIILVSCSMYYFKKQREALYYSTFFEQVNENIWPDYLESNRLYLRTAKFNTISNIELDEKKFEWNELAHERLERITRAKQYVQSLQTFNNKELNLFKEHLTKSMDYLEPSAEGDLIRIEHIVCLLKNLSLSLCTLNKASEDKINAHTAKYNLGVEEFRNFFKEINASKCKKCQNYVNEWNLELKEMLQKSETIE